MLIDRRTFLFSSLINVRAKRKPSDVWTEYPTRTVGDLAGFRPGGNAPACGRYGGRKDRRVKATGFFRAEKIRDRWWMVDPEGYLFLNVGVVSVTPGRSRRNREALIRKFGSNEKWAEEATWLLRKYEFNCLGNWSLNEALRKVQNPLPYTASTNFMGSFGRKLKITYQQPGHMGYPNDVIPVFHPEFEEFCDGYAREVTARKDDPLLMGYFSDNELPASVGVLEKSLALDATDARVAPGREAALTWIGQRKGARVPVADLTERDKDAYLGHLYERYMEVTTRALRKYDPNHLCLGPRIHGQSLRSPGVLRACGRHLDVIAANIYWQWSLDAAMLEMWKKEAGKPFVVTEFYAKGMDAGFANITGAGWTVPTQKDRALFYENFALSLLESKQFAGWHWFKYMDNDPEDLTTDPSNRDSNKGIVKIDYEPYSALLEPMKAFNREVYRLADYFDKGGGA